LGDLSVDILECNSHPKRKARTIRLHGELKLKSQFSGSTTKSQILTIPYIGDPWNGCKYNVTKAYGPIFHKLIYIVTYTNYQTHFQCIKRNH
jgi:hypothetical protein